MEYQKIQSKLSKYIDEDIVADIALCIANSRSILDTKKVGLLNNLLKGVVDTHKKGQEALITDMKQKVSNILDNSNQSEIVLDVVDLLTKLKPLEKGHNKVKIIS